MTVLGAVLAGGRSSRFGSDKAEARWRDRPLIAHVLAALRPRVDAVVVCGRAFAGETALADRPEPGLGPLGGLAAALAFAAEHGIARVLSVPCDVPDLSDALLAALLDRAAPRYLADLPVIGCWPSRLAPALEHHLAAGGTRSVRGWAEAVGARPLAGLAAPSNINRHADLAALTARA